MRSIRLQTLLSCAVLVLLLSPLAARAQTITATVTGTVTDPTGAVVPNATITATAAATGQAKTATSDSEGRYTIPFLPPGEYNVTVESQGFSRTTRNRVTLEVAQTATLDFKLTVGAATDVIEISGDAPLLQTEQSGLETTVENKLIEDLPSAQRSTLAFINNVPGVIDAGFALAQGENLNVNGNAQGPIGSPGNRNFFDSSFSVGGGQNSTNDVLLDGVSNTVGDFNGVAVNPPPDSVREFKVLAGVYSAEYGRSGGGVVNMITKAGTKQFRGALYEYFQNGGLNANGWQRNRRGLLPNGQDVLPRIPIKRNQFGAAIGGPVWLPKNIFGPAGYDNPNKTFFFFNYEGRRERNPFSRELTLPTARMRRGDFTELYTGATRANQTDVDGAASLFGQLYDPFAPLDGNKRPAFAGNRLDTLPVCGPGPRFSACLDPVALEILKYIPLPNQSGLINNYVISDIAKFSRDLYAIRIDQTLSDKHSFFGRYSKEDRFQAEPAFLGSVATNSRIIEDTFHNFTLNDVYSFTPALINNARYGYTRARAHQTPLSEGFDPTVLGFPSYIINTAPIGSFPILNFPDAGAASQGRASEITSGQIGGSGNNQPRDTQTVADSLTWLRGGHTFKFGAEYRLLRFFAFQFNNPTGTYNFSRVQTRGPVSTATPANILETGSSFASFLLGLPASGLKQQVTPITIYHHYYAGFVQDDWKATRNLTLNLGLRWDYETGTGETHDLISRFDPDAPSHLKGRVSAPVDPIVRALRPNFTDLRGLVDFPEGPQTDYPKKRFAPRVGLAYRLGERTVLRGGYGVFFVPYSVEQNTAIGNVFDVSIPQSFDNGQVRLPGGISAPTVFLNNPFPNGITPAPGNSLGADTLIGQSPLLAEGFRRNAYVQQWNVVISRQLARNLVLDVAYAGNHGLRLPYRTLNINQIPTEYLAYARANFASAVDFNGVAATNVSQFFNQQVANPFFGLITNPNSTLRNATVSRGQLLKQYPQYDNPQLFNAHIGASKYNSLQVKLEKRFSQGLSANVNYVWSKLIDIGRNGNNNSGAATNVEDAFDLAGEYAISNFDVPHRFVGSFSYELPFGRRKPFGGDWRSFTQALLGGWQVSGTFTRQSGTPISITALSFGLSFATRRADRVPGDASFDDARARARSGDTWFDTTRFQLPGEFVLGNAARNYTDVRRDGARNIDLSILKNFFWDEGRQKIQFRGEFINALNLVVFGTPGTNINDPTTFGRITTQGNSPRLIQLVLRYTF